MATTIGQQTLLTTYLEQLAGAPVNSAAAAYYAALDYLNSTAPTVARAIVAEFRDQRQNLKLIASENYSSLGTQLAMGNLFTDKYAEGYVNHRFYAGCDNVDTVEAEGARIACALFGADHAFLQPHSGADANLVAFMAILSAKIEAPLLTEIGQEDASKLSRDDWEKVRAAMHGQRIMALDYYSGGHLTHGYRHNISSQLFDVSPYKVNPETKLLDLDQMRTQIREVKPTILLAGYSAYPRLINFAKMREMADEVGAVFMVDMAHFAGLVAGKVFTGDYNPVAHAHVVTSTTHKTLRGPRGGLILCTDEYAPWVDKGCPMVLGGPLPHVMAAKVVALKEASTPEFQMYAHKIVDNARALAAGCIAEGMAVVTGGTDNHLMLIDVAQTYGLTGRQAESALREGGITLNRNAIFPIDPNGPWYTSGLRVGTPGVTTLGMDETEMREIARIMARVLTGTSPTTIATGRQAGQTSKAKYDLDAAVASDARNAVQQLLTRHPLYPELDLDLMSGILAGE
ncbi:MAG: glycine hydroxymethyltransferase [Chloroflexota bacterium]|nr:glycine hydroxymethyltransferase [Chloroflexota bacterium]